METKTVLDNVSGSGSSTGYFISGERHKGETEVQAFLTFASGTVTVEASADGTNYAPIKDGQFTSSEVVPIVLAEGSYLRVSYATAVNLTATIKPKAPVHG